MKNLTKLTTKCGCGYQELKENESGKLLLSGDYYHNKIDSMIHGYLQALRDNKISGTLDEVIIKCPHGCED